MMNEPKCVQWKRKGAEKVQAQIEGFTIDEELEYWRKQTEKLKDVQQKNLDKLSNKSIQRSFTR